MYRERRGYLKTWGLEFLRTKLWLSSSAMERWLSVTCASQGKGIEEIPEYLETFVELGSNATFPAWFGYAKTIADEDGLVWFLGPIEL